MLAIGETSPLRNINKWELGVSDYTFSALSHAHVRARILRAQRVLTIALRMTVQNNHMDCSNMLVLLFFKISSPALRKVERQICVPRQSRTHSKSAQGSRFDRIALSFCMNSASLGTWPRGFIRVFAVNCLFLMSHARTCLAEYL